MLPPAADHYQARGQSGFGPDPEPVAAVDLAIEKRPVGRIKPDVPRRHIPGEAVDPEVVVEPEMAISL
jgi:hypothetical protein